MDDEMLDVGEESFDEPISESYDEPEIIDEIEIIEEPEIIDESEITEEFEFIEDTEITEESEIAENAEIAEEPEIIEDTEITEESEITEDTEITEELEIIEDTEITEESEISDDAEIVEEPEIIEDTEITEESEITEDTEITEELEIIEDTEITEESEIAENAEITEEPEIVEDTEIIETSEITEPTESIDENATYNNISDYLSAHNYGKDDHDTYSQDPEWRRLMQIEYPETELPPLTQETIDDILSPYEGKTYDSISEYYGDHNFGQGDYEIYSQDREWRRLMQIEHPETELPALNPEKVNDILQQYEGRTYDNIAEYHRDHNFSQSDYEIYSQDREWRRLMQIEHPETKIPPLSQERIEGILAPYEGKEYSSVGEYYHDHNFTEGDFEVYSKDPEWQRLIKIENPDYIIPRDYDSFEQSIMEQKPEFKDYYDNGAFYDQGANEYGFSGTCGPTSQANAINRLLGTNELTENKVLTIAYDNDLCCKVGTSDELGGTTTHQFMELYNKVNEQIGDKIDIKLYEYDNAIDVEGVAESLENGSVINVAVDSNVLWDRDDGYFGDKYSDHWITVTGVQRDGDGNVAGFKIIDSGGGKGYVDVDKYERMCFGDNDRKIIDPTVIVVSKKV